MKQKRLLIYAIWIMLYGIQKEILMLFITPGFIMVYIINENRHLNFEFLIITITINFIAIAAK
ncbi:hypothetical protein V1477_007765 [Vespula maculifrons]|uniref:Uncharacterized protein n=1 Tax=Vespula maculifrons TaxID=7453 RepID=A0ABD2CFN6_VESMC